MKETPSEHPLAKAVVTAAQQQRLELPQMSDFKTVTGRGVERKIRGQIYRIGRPEWVSEQKLLIEDDPLDAVKAFNLAQKTYSI